MCNIVCSEEIEPPSGSCKLDLEEKSILNFMGGNVMMYLER